MVLLTNPNVFPWPPVIIWVSLIARRVEEIYIRGRTLQNVSQGIQKSFVWIGNDIDRAIFSLRRVARRNNHSGEIYNKNYSPSRAANYSFASIILLSYSIEARSVATLRSAAMLLQYYWNVAMLLKQSALWQSIQQYNLYL